MEKGKTYGEISIYNINFTGLWIPQELFFIPDLSNAEMLLLAQIHALDPGQKGCYASNEYFSRILRISEGQVANVITSLRKKNFIKNLKGNFRSRRLILDKENVFKFFVQLENPTQENLSDAQENLSDAQENLSPYIRIERKEESIEERKGSDKSETPSESETKSEQKHLNKAREVSSEYKSSEVKVPGIQMSSVEKSDASKKKAGLKAITDPEQLEIVRAFQKNINSMCGAKTPAIIEGVPRAIEMFKERHEDQAALKVIEALNTLGQDIKNKPQWWRDHPYASNPKIIFSAKYIADTLLPLTNNLETNNGKLYNNPLSDAELRQIKEDNARKAKAFLASLGPDGAGA